MTPEEYQEALVMLVQAARAVSTVDVPDLLHRIDRADIVGSMIDPTLWMENHKKMDEDKELMEAALPLWRHAQKYKAATTE